jgi:ribosomal protein L15
LSTTTEKERAVLQELEDSTAKLNSFISTSTSTSISSSSGSSSSSSSSSSKGTAGVKSRNSVSSIKVTKEGGVGSVIDENASVNKQAIQALRFLFKAGR